MGPPAEIRVAQFGAGVFLRGFADWMFQRLRDECGLDVRVSLIQPRNSDSVAQLMRAGAQFTVVQQGLVGGEQRSASVLVRCIDEGINTHQDPAAFERLARDPAVRVVLSNTTEAGIVFSEQDARAASPQAATSFPGKLTWFLHERYRGAVAGQLLILPCELIEDNGARLRELVLQLAAAWGLGAGFTRWLGESVVFYDTLVDRIVPGAPEPLPTLPCGRPDRFAVQTEWFHSWHLCGPEDFLQLLPLHTLCHVHLVPDLRPYRQLKVRLLNGLHSAMAATGPALGLETVSEAAGHEVLGPWLRSLVSEELAPSVELPRERVAEFEEQVWARLANPFISHPLDSILLHSSAKLPARFLGVVTSRVQRGQSSPAVALVVASWLSLSRHRLLPESDATRAALAELWDRYAAGGIDLAALAHRALADPQVLGAAWPSGFAGDVAAQLVGLESSGLRAACSGRTTP